MVKKGRMQVAPTNHLTDKISILPLSKFVHHLPSIVKLRCSEGSLVGNRRITDKSTGR